MKSQSMIVIIIAVVAAAGLLFVSGGSLTPKPSQTGQRELPNPERITKIIPLSPEDAEAVKQIPDKTVIKLDANRTISYKGKTYYLIGKNVGTSILTTTPTNVNGGWGVLKEIPLSVPGYQKVYEPANPCPLYQASGSSGPCSNHQGISLEGHLYALRTTVNQGVVINDPIHTYNIFDVYYHQPVLSEASGRIEQEFAIYGGAGFTPSGKSVGVEVEVELDESVEPPILKVSGHFLKVKVPPTQEEKEFALQGKNISTLSEAVGTFVYLGTLEQVSSTAVNGNKAEVHVYFKDPYLYLSYLSPQELQKQAEDDKEFVKRSENGNDTQDGTKRSLQIRKFRPVRPTIVFDIYVLSDPVTLKPSLGYIRPQITPLHVGVPECPAIYLYGDLGKQFSVKVPDGTVHTIPYTQNYWNGIIVPEGIQVNNNIYKYLSYTKKQYLPVVEPKSGWVISLQEWDILSKNFLPSIGLTEGESKDISDYLQIVTPTSPYYLISASVSENTFPLDISPTPDSFLHYKIFIKPLSKPIFITSPNFVKPLRKGFTAVMWEEFILR